MAGTIPATIVRGTVAADANAPRMPVTPWDQAIAALAADPAALVTAIWAGRTVGGLPQDRVDASIYTASGGTAAPVIAADADIGFTDSSGAFVPLPVFDFRGTGTGGLRSNKAGDFTQSFTVAFVFAPTAVIGGDLARSYNGTYATKISLTSSLFLAYASASGGFVSINRSGRVIDEKANVAIVCGDAATRQIAVYLNSKSPVLSAALAPNPWPDLGGTGDWVFGAADGGKCNARVHGFATFNRSLHHDPACAVKLQRLIAAGAATFGVTLV